MSYSCCNKGYNIENMAANYSTPTQDYNGSSGSYNSSISHLEEAVLEANQEFLPEKSYSSSNSSDYNTNANISDSYSFVSDTFLNTDRQTARFVGKASDIEDYIKQAFEQTSGHEFPDDIQIMICSTYQLEEIHKQYTGTWSNTITGFSVNRKQEGKLSTVFVQKGELDRVMLTLGHEIGHVLTRTLPSKHDEEAKAFAFSLAWMDTISENNIANLRDSININSQPAKNGLHNVAFDFILKLIKQGKRAIDVYKDVIKGIKRIKIENGIML